MTEINITQDDPFIRVMISGKKDEPMREEARQGEATRAAKKHIGAKVSLITSGGSFANGGDWELHYTYVPDGYRFPPRTD